MLSVIMHQHQKKRGRTLKVDRKLVGILAKKYPSARATLCIDVELSSEAYHYNFVEEI